MSDNNKIIDKDSALERLGGDEELFLEILEIFAEDAPKQMETLKEAIASNDTDLTERQAHSLKSASANIGAYQMKEQAFKLEQTARDKEMANAGSLCETLEQELDEVLKLLS